MNDMSGPGRRERESGGGPGDPVAVMSEMLMAQARALDALFGDLVSRAGEQAEWLDAANTYSRLAFRAQANCRTSLEALARAARLQHRDARAGAEQGGE